MPSKSKPRGDTTSHPFGWLLSKTRKLSVSKDVGKLECLCIVGRHDAAAVENGILGSCPLGRTGYIICGAQRKTKVHTLLRISNQQLHRLFAHEASPD